MSLQSSTQTSIGPVGRLGLAALSVWRVTHLIALEDGPFNVNARMRQRLGDGFFGQLTDCFACASVWVAAPVAAALRPRRATDLLLSWLALSGAACLLQRWSADELPELRYRDDKEPQANGML